MTQPDDGQAATRPISVAELLAKNGTIGSPPVGGARRRRRRGNNDAVTVAELTGEIPIVRLGDADGDTAGVFGHEPPERSPDPLPRRGRDTAPERSHYPRPGRAEPAAEPFEPYFEPYEEDAPAAALVIASAETMSPDPVDDAAVIIDDSSVEYRSDDELGIGVAEPAVDAESFDDAELFSGDALLFTGESEAGDDVEPIAGDLSDGLVGEVGDDVDNDEGLGDTDLDGDGEYQAIYDYYDEPTRGQLFVRGLLVALQSILAVVFGAGLFLAFNQLWHWNSLIAMVLAILATLGLVAGVWVVRKTEDIASTLIAVGVGLLVTFGPLALMHATN